MNLFLYASSLFLNKRLPVYGLLMAGLWLSLSEPAHAQIIKTFAGNGNNTFSGDGGLATNASLSYPSGLVRDGAGSLYIADSFNHRIRKVTPDGKISTVAGNGTAGFSGDGNQATNASLNNPADVALDGAGNLYIADLLNNRIRKVTPDGNISTVVGNGTAGFGGDGGLATSASLNNPAGVALDGSGNLYIADYMNHRIRKVTLDGKINTVAGNGTAGFVGDGGQATSTSLNYPVGVALDGSGNLYIADSFNNRIRKVTPDGKISTVAGDGTADFSGDGGAATNASLNEPFMVTLDGSGNLYIADTYNNRIRKVDLDGNISTVAGNGNQGFSGENVLATSATMNHPYGVILDGLGNLYIADARNSRVRRVAPNVAPTVANAIPNQTALLGLPFSYTLPANAFTDAESPNSLTYTASIDPANGLTYDTSTQIISGTPVASGSSLVTVVATDPGNLTVSQTFTVNTIPNTAPTVANAIPNQTALLGLPFSYTLPANAFTDAESPNSLTYTASIDPANGLTYDPSTRVISGTPVASGSSLVTVVATDPGNLTVSQTFTVNTPSVIRYVKPGASGSGNSWIDASGDLQSQINFVTAREVWVAAGTYKPTSTTARSISFSMKSGVAIYGGFLGNEPSLNQRPGVNPVNGQSSSSILSGDIGTVGDASDNSYHVISNLSGLNSTAVLDGFVITGGNANGNLTGPNSNGGGILNQGIINACSPTLRNCLFQNNLAASVGGAMFNGVVNGSSSPVLINCSFQNNSVQDRGGAIYNEGYLGNSSPVLTNCSFQNNSAQNSGGALYNDGYSGNSSPVLANCFFQANSAKFGGVMLNNGDTGISSPIMTNCSFQNNSAQALGGAILNDGSNGSSNPVLVNCVLFNNGNSNTFYNSSAGITANYSLFDKTVTGYTGSNNLTTTTSPFTSTSAAQLYGCSPAVNAGDPSSTTATGTPAVVGNMDLAGNPRFYQNGRIDMGAYEYQATPIIISLSNPAVSIATVGSAFSQTFTASGGTSAYSYTLASGSLPGSLSLASTGELSGIPTQSGSFSLTVQATDASGCVGVSGLYSLTISDPTTTIRGLAVNPVAVCVGTTTTFTATVGFTTGSYGYTLTNGSDITLSGTGNSSGFSQDVTASGSGVQAFTLTVSSGGQVASATTSLTVNAIPTVDLTNNGPLTCAQTSVTLTASGGTTGETFSYTFTDGKSVLGTPGPENTLIVSSAGAYSVTVANASGCVSSTSTTVMSTTAVPVATILASPSTTLSCQLTSLTLTAGGGDSYDFSGPGIVSQSGGIALVNASGTYSVTVTNTATGCFSTTSITISQDNTALTATLVSSGTLTCALTSVTLTASANGLTYVFSPGATQIGSSNQAIVSSSGPYSVTVISDKGCSGVASVTVSQNTTAPRVNLTNNGPLSSAMSTVTLTASGGNGTYVFNSGATQINGGNTATVTTTGIYSVTGFGTNGCSGVASTIVTLATANNGPVCDTYTNKSVGNNVVRGVYVVTNTLYAATIGGVGISTNGGNTFTIKTTANGLGSNSVNGVFVANNIVYAATTGGLSISTDGGTNFTNKRTADGLGSNSVNDVYVVNNTVYAATSSGLSISTDGGNTFTNKTTANGLGSNSVNGVFVANNIVYAATSGGLSISTDGGNTFTNKTTANGLGNNSVTDVFVVGSTVYAGNQNGISISVDGGNTFITRSISLPVSSVYAVGNTVYATYSGFNTNGVTISTDGGNTFTSTQLTNTPNEMFVLDNKIYIATINGISSCAVACNLRASISASSDSPIYTGQTVTLTASTTASTGLISYTWSTSETTPSISVSPGSTTTYSVTAVSGFCSSTATITVTVLAQGDACFSANKSINLGPGSSYFVTNGDFNNDGLSDLVEANLGRSTISVLLGTTGGNFGNSTNFSVGSGPIWIAVGDFNGDNKQDLAVANSTDNTVSILIGTGTGNFTAGTTINVLDYPTGLAVADFNKDGKQDLAVTNANSDKVSVLLGTGTGSFGTARNLNVGTYPSNIVVGDFNKDNKLDLATSNNNSNTVSILLGTGTGNFSAATSFAVGAAGTVPQNLTTGDFNADGNPDLAVVVTSSTVNILLGNGSGGFGSPTLFTVGDYPISVAATDINGDGKTDLITSNFHSSDVSVLLNTGSGSFRAPTNFATGAQPRILAVSDINNDGKLELITANQGASTVSILYDCSIEPVIGINSASPASVCSGGTLSLTTTVSGFTPTGYTWTSTPTGFSATGLSPTFIAPTVGTPTDYILTVTATDGNITRIATTTLTVNSLPTLSISPSSTTLTNASPIASLTAIGTGTFLWSTGETSSVISVTTSGNYSVTLTSPGGCTASASVPVIGSDLTVTLELPQANFAASGTAAVGNFLVNVFEVAGLPTSSGNVTITVTAPIGYTLSFASSLTSINVSGGAHNPVTVNNGQWTVSRSVTDRQLSLTMNAGAFIGGGGESSLGFSLTRTSANPGSTASITVNVADDLTMTYDGNLSNNVYARIISGL